MIGFINRIVERYPFLSQFLKFSTVGLINTAIDFTVYFSLTRLSFWWMQHYLLANLLAFLTANLFSFLANKNWTFQNKSSNHFRQYFKFLLISLISLAAVQASLYFQISKLGWWDLPAKLVALGVSVSINFVGAKFWAFK